MVAVDGIVSGAMDKAALWEINTEQQYHEAAAEEQEELAQAAMVP
jgi:hypothetical protein